MDSVADALMEYETIEGKHVLEILEHGELRSPVISTKPIDIPPIPAAEKNGDKKGKDEPEAGLGSAAPNPA